MRNVSWMGRGAATALALLPGLGFATVTDAQVAQNPVPLMTQNMDEGTNFTELVAARSPEEFVTAVTTTFQNILATNPAERAAAMASEIALHDPDLVGLQEASILRTGPAGAETTVQSDLLQLLLEALEARGRHYTVVAVLPGLDADPPSTLGFNVRLTTRDAIIARSDLPPGQLKLSNVQAQHYLTTTVFPTPVGPVTIPRGWIAVDVQRRGQSFRFVTTHLDVVPPVQLAQAKELLQTVTTTPLPIVLTGDFNASADNPADPTFATYQTLVAGGFRDAWTEAHPADPGFTCCQAANLLNLTSSLDQRIDLVLLRGSFRVDTAMQVGDASVDRTPSGLWPSDHAGLAVTFEIPRNPNAN